MIPKDRLLRLLQKLRQKTDAGEVNWVPHEDLEYGCQLSLNGLTVELIYQPSQTGPDRVRVRVNEHDPKTGTGLAVAELTAEDDEDDNDWSLFFGLYQGASKEAYHWDRVLSELESAVSRNGKIGLTDDQVKAELSPVNR